MRNASKLLSAAAPFASIVLRRSDWGCKGKDYINDGVMLLRPSVEAYAALYGSFVSGEFVDCGGSEKALGDQDVVRHHLFETQLLGPLHEWPICYNYRGWRWQQHCQQKEIFLFHMAHNSAGRPTTIKLPQSPYAGEAAAGDVLAKGYREPVDVNVASLPRALRMANGPLDYRSTLVRGSALSKCAPSTPAEQAAYSEVWALMDVIKRRWHGSSRRRR